MPRHKKSSTPRAARLQFGLDEAVYPWLAPLLDAYREIDQGVLEAVARAEARGRRLACAAGCSACCRTHQDIPVYPQELVGLTWYAVERLESPLRERLLERLEAWPGVEGCVFLVDGRCSVHPMRPMACRQFNVVGAPCAEGEDAFHARPGDVLRPARRHLRKAFWHMLPFYGVEDGRRRREMAEAEALHGLARELGSCDWSTLAGRMREKDRGRGA